MTNRFDPRLRLPNSGGRFLSRKEMESALRPILASARKHGIAVAVVGGYAMAYYGSDRLTSDVDVAALHPIPGFPPTRRLSFGGFVTKVKGITVDVIVRSDGYAGLYEEAILSARGIVSPDFLAAMKLAAGRPKDLLDLDWLLQQPKLVNRKKARKIVEKFLGGQFAAEEFDALAAEADWHRKANRRGAP